MEIDKLFEKTYKGKKVFLTGHTGFKGAWLALWLQSLGAVLKGYSLKPETNESLFSRIKKNLECETVISDITDKNKLEKAIIDFQPDYIFHLAAKSLVRYSYAFPLETFETNIIGTANLLNALLKLKKKCIVIIVTTDKVYNNKDWPHPYREVDELGGYDPYSASKACAEIVTGSFRNSFFNIENYSLHQKAISTVRAGNVIGGGDYSNDRIIPDIVKSLGKKKPVIIRNPDSIRPWQYILEPLYGYLLLGGRMSQDPIKYSGAYNFGPYLNDNITVVELVKMAIEFWGNGSYEISKRKNEHHEAAILRLDISKAINVLNWEPVLNSHEAIKNSILWYKASLDRSENIFELTSKYLRDYKNRLTKSD